jgi:hypothetical protein
MVGFFFFRGRLVFNLHENRRRHELVAQLAAMQLAHL